VRIRVSIGKDLNVIERGENAALGKSECLGTTHSASVHKGGDLQPSSELVDYPSKGKISGVRGGTPT